MGVCKGSDSCTLRLVCCKNLCFLTLALVSSRRNARSRSLLLCFVNQISPPSGLDTLRPAQPPETCPESSQESPESFKKLLIGVARWGSWHCSWNCSGNCSWNCNWNSSWNCSWNNISKNLSRNVGMQECRIICTEFLYSHIPAFLT